MHFPNRLGTLIAADGLNRGIERSAGDARKPSHVRGILRFRLSAFGFPLSAFGFPLSALEESARRREEVRRELSVAGV